MSTTSYSSEFEQIHELRMRTLDETGSPVGLTAEVIIGWIESGELEESYATEVLLNQSFGTSTYGRHHKK